MGQTLESTVTASNGIGTNATQSFRLTVPDPPDPVAVPDLLVQARAANLARSALGLRPAVHELVACLRLPLPHERDLDHNKDPLNRCRAGA